LGLVDQVNVPYYWAVSLFDKHAKTIACCPMNQASATSMAHPFVSTINTWMLICVLDVLIRRLFGLPSSGNVPREIRIHFLQSLFDIARYKLPAQVIEDSGLEAQQVSQAINLGKEMSGRPASADSDSLGSRSDSRCSSANQEQQFPSPQRVMRVEAVTVIGHELLQSPVLLSMLLEPEVLHVVTQYESLFRKLHACYTEDGHGLVNGHMSYGEFLQFCMDFHITPALVASHFLQHAYNTARCVEACTSEDLSHRYRQSTLPRSLRIKIQRILRNAVRSGELLYVLDEMERAAHQRSSQASTGGNQERKSLVRAQTVAVGTGAPSLQRGTSPTPVVGDRVSSAKSISSDLPPRRSVGQTGASARRISSNEGKSEKSEPPPAFQGANSAKKSVAAASNRRQSLRSNGKCQSAQISHAVPKRVALHRSRPKPKAPEIKKVEGPAPWADVTATARFVLEPKPPRLKQKTAPSKFGVSAFAETLCRIAFTYLPTYGNQPQVSSFPHVRVVWLISYLRCVFAHLRKSLDKRAGARRLAKAEDKVASMNAVVQAFAINRDAEDETPEEKALKQTVHEPLLKALRNIRLEQLERPPLPTCPVIGHTTLRSGLPETAVSDALVIQKRRRSMDLGQVNLLEANNRRNSGQSDLSDGQTSRRGSAEIRKRSKKMNTQEIRAVEAAVPSSAAVPEQPCIVDGVCKLCEGAGGPGEWGDPRCRGCSIVDVFSFKDHLFKALLVHEPPRHLKGLIAESPLRSRRHAMTPPPMGTPHALRKHAESPSSGSRKATDLGAGGSSPRRKVNRQPNTKARMILS
jgi:hypothetical protein